jgi:hypothetical protein
MKPTRNLIASNAPQGQRGYMILFDADEAVATLRSNMRGSEPAVIVVAFLMHCETVGSDLPEAEAVAKLRRLMSAGGAPLGIICGVMKGGTREVEMGPFGGLPDLEVPITVLQQVCATILEGYRRTGTLPGSIPLNFEDLGNN